MKSLFEQLREYGESSFYPCHMPGHKRKALGDMPEEIALRDITEIEGFDNLHQPEEILYTLQKQAADLYGAEESFYLVNGSTCGILSAISAALPMGGHILMARGSHKSAYHAAYLRKLKVTYLYPDMLSGYDIYDAIKPEQIKQALDENPDIQAVFLVSPTYEGRIAQVEEIAEIVHEKGIPLIVDEAHGAHLGFHEKFAKNSCQAGADMVIHSVHKTLPAMTQAALLHVNGKLIDRDLLKRFLRIYQSSSPSYLLMASIDNALRVISEKGEELFADFYTNYSRMLEILDANCKNLKFLPLNAGNKETTCSEENKIGNITQDVGKLIISSKQGNISGQKIYELLLKEYQIQLEMAAPGFCLAMFTIGDKEDAYERMTRALLSIDKLIAEEPIELYNRLDGMKQERPKRLLPLAHAWDALSEWILLEDSVGCCVAEFVNLYPPGVPILVPGEQMSETICRSLFQYLKEGLNVQGIRIEFTKAGNAVYKIRVVNQKEN